MKSDNITATMIAPCGLDCSLCKRALLVKENIDYLVSVLSKEDAR